MSTFLQELTTRLLSNHTHDLSQLVLMFPSLRARAFFNDAIQQTSTAPVWQPRCTTIDEIMERGSGLKRGERIRLIAELFKIYHAHHPNESFDRFYHWGDMLISDFDMIDKYMVNAKALLRNIEDIKEIEADVSYITERQEKLLMQFWSSIHNNEKGGLTKHKLRFLEVWRSLPAIYEEYRAHLTALGIGYSGLIYRATAERIQRGEDIGLEPKRHIIAGFNALSTSEQVLFDYISKSEHGAEFYWDYDNYYVDNPDHEAGLFMRKNIKQYNLNEPLSHNNFTEQPKRLEATACVSNISQVKHISNILKEIPKEELDKQTAIVLTDENLLTPLLHSLPKEIGKVNITMGYPLKNTLIYSFFELLTALQSHSRKKDDATRFYHQDVTWILSHPYIMDCCKESAEAKHKTILTNRMVSIDSELFADDEILSLIFTKQDDWRALAQYMINVINIIMQHMPTNEYMQIEHLSITAEEIAKTIRSIDDCDIKISTEVFVSFLRRHLQTVTIPYEGEPLEGVQILGILETRNIDFKNVIILSMTDANFPGNHTDKASFIPYSLRIAYDMPTPDQHEAMYAYYFYRLVQRAKRVDMLYCSRADEKSTGECSRYIYQLDFEYKGGVKKRAVGVDLSIEDERTIEIAKGEEEMKQLMLYTNDNKEISLSPTALFRYVECPLKFYFASVAKLRTRNELTDKIDALTFGNILHNTMEALYKRNNVVGVKNPMQIIEELRKEEVVRPIVDEVIIAELHKNTNTTAEDFSGDTLLVRDIIVKYIINGIMRYDANREGFTISAIEDNILYRYDIDSGVSIKLAGRADRIDTLPDNTLQIIDYKSGYQPHLEYKNIETLFAGTSKQRISNIFQTMLYSMILRNTKGVDTTPSLYYASRMLNDNYSPLITDIDKKCEIKRYSMIAEEFEEQLQALLNELFDPSVPFRQVEDKNTCTRCDYNRICRR